LLLLQLSDLNGGITCCINGIKRKVRCWSPLGYTELTSDTEYSKLSFLYPNLSSSTSSHSTTAGGNAVVAVGSSGSSGSSVTISIAGIHVREKVYRDRCEALSLWRKDCLTGLGSQQTDQKVFFIFIFIFIFTLIFDF
jgi:hypothetical protein